MIKIEKKIMENGTFLDVLLIIAYGKQVMKIIHYEK